MKKHIERSKMIIIKTFQRCRNMLMNTICGVVGIIDLFLLVAGIAICLNDIFEDNEEQRSDDS